MSDEGRADDGWSPPDGDGIRSLRLSDPKRSSLKGKRLRRANPTPGGLALDTWPADERQLLAEWVRRAGDKPSRHSTLLASAGATRTMLADRLLQRLLQGGGEQGQRGRVAAAVELGEGGFGEAGSRCVLLGVTKTEVHEVHSSAHLHGCANDDCALRPT